MAKFDEFGGEIVEDGSPEMDEFGGEIVKPSRGETAPLQAAQTSISQASTRPPRDRTVFSRGLAITSAKLPLDSVRASLPVCRSVLVPPS